MTGSLFAAGLCGFSTIAFFVDLGLFTGSTPLSILSPALRRLLSGAGEGIVDGRSGDAGRLTGRERVGATVTAFEGVFLELLAGSTGAVSVVASFAERVRPIFDAPRCSPRVCLESV